MSEKQNIATLQRGYALFSRGDIDGLLALFDSGVEWYSPGPPELRTSGRRRGHEQVREFFTAVAETYDMQNFEPTDFIAEGDRVVVIGQDTFAVRATGRTLSETWVHVFRFRNGKVVSFTEFLDTSPVVAELERARTRP